MTKIYLNDNTVYFDVSGSVFTLYDPGRTVAAEIFQTKAMNQASLIFLIGHMRDNNRIRFSVI